jgi:acid stress chaperone HdeA
MKPALVPVLALSALVAAPAFAAAQAKKPLSQWTCQELLAMDDQFKPKAIYWATAYGKGGKPESATLDIDGTETVTPAIIDTCTKSPGASFWQTLKGEWQKVDSAAKKDVKKIEKAL